MSVKSKKSGSRPASGKRATAAPSSRKAQPSAAKSGRVTARPAAKARATGATTRRAAPRARAAPPASRQAGVNEDGEALQALQRYLAEAIEQFTAAVQRIETDIERLVDAARSAPPEGFARVTKVFTAELKALLGETAPDDEAVRRAARQAFAEQAWERRLGELLDVSDVVSLLDVTRQHVNALAQQERLISLSEDGRRRFPAWQFAGTTAAQRRCLAEAHQELVAQGGLSPWTAASWMQADHPELDDQDPVSFLRSGGACDLLSTVAGRDAARSAQ